jgi:uncharacterized protein (DUF305 family)
MGSRRARSVLPLAALVTVLAGCSAAGATEAARSRAPAPTPPPVIVPGGPGEPARVLPGDEAAGLLPDTAPTEADVRFVQRMIPHHQQAIEMAALAPGRVADPQVAELAERIRDAQGVEIEVMQAWLDDHVAGADPGHGHHHADMPGMATPVQLAELAAASGPQFDQLFLTLMITHHEGALTMVEELIADGGRNVRVAELAQGIAVTQAAEVDRMRAMLGQ